MEVCLIEAGRGVEEVRSVVIVLSACAEGAVEAGDWRPAVAAVGGVGCSPIALVLAGMLAVGLVECVELPLVVGESWWGTVMVEVPAEVVHREMEWCDDAVAEAKAVVVVEIGL